MELLVHIRDVENMPDLVYSEVEFPDTLLDSWSQDSRPTDAILNSAILSREMGDNWLQHQIVTVPLARESASEMQIRRPVLQVPTSVI